MKETFFTFIMYLCSIVGYAQNAYFSKPTAETTNPDSMGFIRRWTLLEPINKPNRSNTVFTETYLTENIGKELFPGQWTARPKDGQKIKVEQQKLAWHKLDSKNFNVKLFRFASSLNKQLYGVIFCVNTIVHCDSTIHNVRLAAGTNGASSWWINGKKVLTLANDRRMVQDDGVSPTLTLNEGDNVISGVIINGPGMSDFCIRFIDNDCKPVTGYSIP